MTRMRYLRLAVACGAVLLCVPTAWAAEKRATDQTGTDVVAQAFSLRMNGQVDEARRLLERRLKTNPESPAAWLELARLEFQRGGTTRELNSAQKAIEKAIAVAPDSAALHCWAARIAVYNGILRRSSRTELVRQFQKAAAAREKAVELDPDDHEARLILVDLYDNNPPDLGGDQSRARHHVEALEKRSPIDGAIARCRFELEDDSERRLSLWKDLAEKHGKDPRVHENLAREYARIGDVERAVVHADKVLTLDPGRGLVLLDLARAFALTRKLEPAEKLARRYLELDPPAPRPLGAWAHMALGRIRMMKGDQKTSSELMKKARELDSYCWFTMTPPPEELFRAP